MEMPLIANRYVVDAIAVAAVSLFAMAALGVFHARFRWVWEGVVSTVTGLRTFEKVLLGLAFVSTCLVGDGKVGGGRMSSPRGEGSASRAAAGALRSGCGSVWEDAQTNYFFTIDSFLKGSNSIVIGTSWSPGYFTTGSVINLYGRLGSLTNESELILSRTVDSLTATGMAFNAVLGDVEPSAAFFRLVSACDADGDGLADWFERNEFGSDPNVLDTDGDGFLDSAEYVLGLDPVGTAVPQVVDRSDNVSACRLTEPFSAESTNGLAGPVFVRTVNLPRRDTFTQYFLSADPMGAMTIDASGFEISYFDDAGHTGTVDAAGLGDGVRLSQLAASFNSITVTIAATSNELQIASDLHLVAYRPVVEFPGAQEVSPQSALRSGANLLSTPPSDDILVVIGKSVDVWFDYTGRPSSEPISDEEDRANPFEGIGGLSYDPSSHVLTAAHSGVYTLHDGRTLIFLSPSVSYGHGHGYVGTRVYYNPEDGTYSEEPPYPLDTACLYESWYEGYANPEGCSCEPTVRSGLEEYGGDGRVTTDYAVYDETAMGYVRVYGTTVWRGTAAHSPYDRHGGVSDSLSGDPCESCSAGCKDGNCDALETPSLGSVRFRIPLGNPEAEHVSGFLYFNRDQPFTVRASSFRLLARPDAIVEDGTDVVGRRTVSCYDNRGRTVILTNTLDGVEIDIFDALGDFEHCWMVSTTGNTMRFRKISRLDNVMMDRSYALRNGFWVEVDSTSGLETELHKTGSLAAPGGRTEERIARDGNMVVEHEAIRSELVGTGANAVVREVERRELAAGGVWRVSHAAYWDDPSHPRRHGALKLEWGDDRDWRYCDYDGEGRETFRLDQRNGSDVIAADGNWSLSNLPSVEAFATVSDYAPLPGDGRHANDWDKVRTESRYVVRGDGTAVLIGRTWRKYVHGWDSLGETVEVTTIRAASPTSGIDDGANAVTVETRYDDESWAVPCAFRGEPCSRIEADGVETRWSSWYDGDGVRTEERRYLNGVEAETYKVTVRDETYGNLLYEATALTADGTEFGWKSHTYDEKNRLILTRYDDGSFETNAYSCCRFLWTIDRNGAKTLRSATTGTDHLYYADEEVYMAALPYDADLTPEGWWTIYYRDGFRATLHFFDALGRETNVSVRSAYKAGKFVNPLYRWYKAEQERNAQTTYPEGVSDYAVTVDSSGRTITVLRSGTSASEVTETSECDRGSDVPTSTTELEVVRGGGMFERKTMADGGWTLSSRFDEYDAAGCRTAFDLSESSDCGIVTNRIDRYDFLGRQMRSETPQSVISTVYLGASDRVLFGADLVSGRVTTNIFDEVGELVGVASCGVESRSVVSYAVVSDELWRVNADIVFSGVTTTSCSTVKTRLTGLSDALRSETVREKDGVEIERAVSSFDAAANVQTTIVTSSESGVTVSRSMFGRETEREAPDGHYRNFFDPWGRVFLVQRTKSDGSGLDYYRSTDYDAHDRETVWYDMVGDVPSSAYRRWSGYDCRGNLVAVTNDLKDVVSYAYDGENRLVEESGDTYRVRYAYDTAGRRTLLETTRDGVVFDRTEWTYDPATGNCLAKTYADGSQTLYTYTPDGLPLRTTAPTGHWTENVYDANRRLVCVQSDDASCCSTIANDVFGRPVSAVSSAASYAYRLSGCGVATNEHVTIGSAAFTLQRTLDPLGRVAGIAVSGSVATSISYSDCGRIAAISNADAVVTYDYDLLKSDVGYTLTLANGRTFSRILTRPLRHHDEQISSVANVTGASTNVYDYAYDRLYRPTVRNADRFAYNRRGEVAFATVAGEASAYAYDGIGNFTTVTGGAVTNVYTTNELNQYEEVASGDTTLEPTYTSNGELASFGPWTYAYDALSRLVAAYSNGTLVVSNRYDYLGRRVQKIAADGTHTFLYDGWRPVVETVAKPGGGTDRIEYYWGKDLSGTLDGAAGVGGLLYVKRNGTIYVPFYDAYGNVMGYWDEQGAIVAEYSYDAFGRTVAKSGTMADVFSIRYSTKYYDAETGMYYYGRRYYQLALCRWLTRDPIEEQGGVNLYCFLINNSLCMVDISGEKTAKGNDKESKSKLNESGDVWVFVGSVRESHEWSCMEWDVLPGKKTPGTAARYVEHFKFSLKSDFTEGVPDALVSSFAYSIVSTLGMFQYPKSYWCLDLDPFSLYKKKVGSRCKYKIQMKVLKLDRHPCKSEKPELSIKEKIGKTFTVGPM